jgi:hypothetical protein
MVILAGAADNPDAPYRPRTRMLWSHLAQLYRWDASVGIAQVETLFLHLLDKRIQDQRITKLEAIGTSVAAR